MVVWSYPTASRTKSFSASEYTMNHTLFWVTQKKSMWSTVCDIKLNHNCDYPKSIQSVTAGLSMNGFKEIK